MRYEVSAQPIDAEPPQFDESRTALSMAPCWRMTFPRLHSEPGAHDRGQGVAAFEIGGAACSPTATLPSRL